MSSSIEGTPQKLYVVTLRFNGLQKRLFLAGEDSEEGREQYRRAIQGLNQVGDKCTESSEFFTKAIEHFERFGFLQTAH